MTEFAVEQYLMPGMSGGSSLTINANCTVPAFATHFPSYGDMPPVVATIMVIGLMEECCTAVLVRHLPRQMLSLGYKVDMKHLAPSTAGTINAKCELTKIQKNRVQFEVDCWHNGILIGQCMHERVIVDRDGFNKKLISDQS